MANGLLANAHESNTDLLWAGSGGFDTVYHDDTLTGMGTELFPLGVNSAYLNDTPWLSASKEIAQTQTLQPGQYIQAISSLTVSGYKNHCVAVKGGGFVFPTVDQLKEWVGTDGYLPTSSFENYTAYNEANITALYDSASNLINSSYYLIDNKLDVSAFNEWSANLDLSGDYIPTSASGNFYPMTGNPSGFLTTHQDISNLATKDELLDTSSFLSASISSISSFVSGNDDKYYPLTGNPSGFLTEHQDLSYISGKIDDKLDTTALENLSGEFYPMTGNPSGFLTEHQDLSDYATTSIVNNISSYLSGEIDNKLDKSESANYYPMTGNPSGFLTAHQSLEDYYKKTETSSKEELSAMFAQFSADETYLLKGGYNIGISSDDINKETTIYYTGTNGDEQVNQVVRQYSADGTWVTNNDLTNYYTKTDTSSKEELSAALANAGHVYSGVSPIVVNNTENKISANTWEFSAGEGIKFVDNNSNKITRIDLGISAGENISLVYDVETHTYRIDGTSEGKIYNGVSPIIVNNTNNTISMSGMNLSAGPGINLYEAGNNIVISAASGGSVDPEQLTAYALKTEVDTVSSLLSAGLDNVSSKLDNVSAGLNNVSASLNYVSANVGKTYSGVAPIIVNNVHDIISISGEELSAGPGINIFESGGYVVISAGNDDYNFFPITGTDGTANFTANANCSSFTLTTAQGAAGCYVNLDAKNVLYESYPSTTVSASWYDILNKANEASSNCYCFKYDDTHTAVNLSSLSAYDKVTITNARNYGQDCLLHWDGKTKEIPSGLYIEMIKGTFNSQTEWYFASSGWLNQNWWNYD